MDDFQMKKRPLFSCLLLAAWAAAAGPLAAGPADTGGTGLLRLPSARLLDDGDLRLGVAESRPYRSTTVTFAFLPFLELNARLTELRDRPLAGAAWDGYGYHKDKAADVKLLLLGEGPRRPAVALGVHDITGNQYFFSEYVVASKRFGPLDLSAGWGGRALGGLARKDRTAVRELDGPFAGLRWELSERFALLAEYDPTPALALGRGDIGTPWNAGFRWRVHPLVELGYSWQRGERHGLLFSLRYPFGARLPHQAPDPPFPGPVDWSPLADTARAGALAGRAAVIRGHLAEFGFPGARVTFDGTPALMAVSFENRHYHSHLKALGRVMRVLITQAPPDVAAIAVTIEHNGLAMVRVTMPRDRYIAWLLDEIPLEEFLADVRIAGVPPGPPPPDDDFAPGETVHPSLERRFQPVRIESYWNDPSRFLRGRFGPALTLTGRWPGGTLVEGDFQLPLYSDVQTARGPISDEPVRSDIHRYLADTGPAVPRLLVNHFRKIGPHDYLRLGAGWLELQYAGFSGEYLRTLAGGRLTLGPELTWAHKRSAGSLLGLENQRALTAFLNLYYYEPALETTLGVKAGRFLAGDPGARFELSRDIRGGRVFLWYTRTDTGDFTGPNRGYADKGVGFTLPLRVFSDHDRPGLYRMAVAPWSRDVGQAVRQPHGLYEFIREFTPAYVRRNFAEVRE